MSYSVVSTTYFEGGGPNDPTFTVSADKLETLLNNKLNEGFRLYGELKQSCFRNRQIKELTLIQSVYKYDDLYDSVFFETTPQEDLLKIPREIVIKRISMSNDIDDVDTDIVNHVFLPYGEPTTITTSSNEFLSLIQCFYKYKKTDLAAIDYRPDSEKIQKVAETFNPSVDDKKVGGYKSKSKTNKNRRIQKLRMRKTRHKR
jgi:hypothetical protein